MMHSTGNLHHARPTMMLGQERLDHGGGGDGLLPSAILVRDARLVERVETPSKDLASLVDGKRVVGSRTDEDNLFEGEALGREAVGAVTYCERGVSNGARNRRRTRRSSRWIILRPSWHCSPFPQAKTLPSDVRATKWSSPVAS